MGRHYRKYRHYCGSQVSRHPDVTTDPARAGIGTPGCLVFSTAIRFNRKLSCVRADIRRSARKKTRPVLLFTVSMCA